MEKCSLDRRLYARFFFKFIYYFSKQSTCCSKQCLIGLCIGLLIGIVLVIAIAVPIGVTKTCPTSKSNIKYYNNLELDWSLFNDFNMLITLLSYERRIEYNCRSKTRIASILSSSVWHWAFSWSDFDLIDEMHIKLTFSFSYITRVNFQAVALLRITIFTREFYHDWSSEIRRTAQ